MLNKAFLLGILSASMAVSLSIQADTPNENVEPTLLSQISKAGNADTSTPSSELEFKQGNSSVELYGTVDVGYEYRK